MQNQDRARQQYQWLLLALHLQSLELKREHEQLQHFEELVSDLSHDMRSSLSHIQTCLYILKNTADPDRQQQYFKRLEAQVQGLSKLVEDTLTTSRLSNDSALQLMPANLNALLQSLMDVCYLHIEQQELGLRLDFEADLPPVLVNEIELSRALSNLIENALTYTPQGGSITIRTFTEEADVVVQVMDTGIGIARDELPRIFERFYRSDEARQSNQNGTGLGLAISSRIVELHGGKMAIRSEPGQGSTFSIHLPAIQRDE